MAGKLKINQNYHENNSLVEKVALISLRLSSDEHQREQVNTCSSPPVSFGIADQLPAAVHSWTGAVSPLGECKAAGDWLAMLKLPGGLPHIFI